MIWSRTADQQRGRCRGDSRPWSALSGKAAGQDGRSDERADLALARCVLHPETAMSRDTSCRINRHY